MSASQGGELEVARFRSGLLEIYAELDTELRRLAPVCRLSGRCCRFAEFDHTLFLSAAAAALLVADAPPPVRPLDRGETCPWQDEAGRCTAREARPLGCRVFYCDPEHAEHAPLLSEQFLTRLKRLTADHGLPWDYAPLHEHLRQALSQGRFRGPVAASEKPLT